MLINIYIHRDSLPCFATVKALRQLGLPFATHYVDDQPQLEQALREQGFDQFPVVIADDLSWSGLRPDMINRLRLKGHAAYA